MAAKVIELTDFNGKIAKYKLQKNENYKKLCNFLNISSKSIYCLNDSDCNFYWLDCYFNGDWFRGGYHSSPICGNFSDMFVNLDTFEIYKRI